MTVTAKDLRFKISMLFDVLNRGEDIMITYRGKPKARLVPYVDKVQKEEDDELFGMWKDKTDDVEQTVRDMRAGRSFGL